MKKVGILVGREVTFPDAIIKSINERGKGEITAEYVTVGGVRFVHALQYDLIIDRISHEIPFYRAMLTRAALEGTIVINNPLWWSADDKFFNYSLAHKLGIAIPKTVLLPQQDYIKGVVSESLRNLEFPLDWKGITEYIGWPAIVKPFDGGGWKNVSKVHNMDELLREYNQSGTLCMTLHDLFCHPGKGPIPWRKAVDYGLQMGSALEYTHAQGVVHRDIKPGNFLLTSGDQVKLSDFGLAPLTAGQHLTADGKTVGTLLYMAPEQISGTPPESPQTDLYSLGCVFYEMLTGKPVFNALAAGKIIHAHLQDPPPLVRDSSPDVPIEFENLIQELLKKRDQDRPPSAAVVADRLRNLVTGRDWGRVDTPSIGSHLLAGAPAPTSVSYPPRSTLPLPQRGWVEL